MSTSSALFNNIQGNILKPHNRNFVLFLFYKWKNKSDVTLYQDWVKKAGKFVTTHTDQLEGTVAFKLWNLQSFVITLGLSYHAFECLKVADRFQEEYDFNKGTNAGNNIYRPDYGKEADKKPPSNLPNSSHHAILCIAHDNKDILLRKGEEIITELDNEDLLEAAPKQLCIEQNRGLIEPGKIKGKPLGPLGFEDNISNTKATGKILIDAFGLTSDYKKNLKKLGTFMAIQEIFIHRKKFNDYVVELAEKLRKAGAEGDMDALAKAYLIGRFPNGTPLTLSPVSSNEERNENNSFDYREDLYGKKCPRHAHIRSANPRHKDVKNLPIVRRSVVFNQERDGTIEETMLFISFQSSIEKNLKPIYQRMLGKDKDKSIRRDALLYSHNDKAEELTYFWKYGRGDSERAADIVTQKRPGGDITTLSNGFFYYCPSKTFLDDPK